MSLARRIRELLDRYETHAKKRLGQNFLIDAGILARIADAAVEGASTVIEIGPGLGTLTEALLDRGVGVVAVEKDPTMVRILEAELPHPKLRIVQGDILDLAYRDLGEGAHVAGNIPYNVSAPIVLGLLAQRADIGPATLMVQREVADRLASPPGSTSYGSLSVMLQMHADVEKLIRVPPGAFLPAPKVQSTVLRLTWLAAPRFPVPPHFERVVRAAFAQRRKMLRNSLRTAFSGEAIARAGEVVALDRRAETLSLEEMASLAFALDPAD